MWGAGATQVGGGDVEALVAQVKELQKSDPGAKQAWSQYASKLGGGNKDPARHDADFLTNFLSSYSSGALGGSPQAAAGGIAAGGAHPDGIVGQVKELQRSNPQAKEAWIKYTETHGENVRDPAKHTQEFLAGFIQYVSSGAAAAETGGGELGPVIKMLQSRSGKFKAVWATYCQQKGSGKNDPNAHDMSYHVQFFDTVCGQYMSNENAAKRMRVSGGGANPFVERVKAFQKSSPENKELWGQYADTYLAGKRDPAKHEASVLQEFCNNHAVPSAAALAAAGGGAAAPLGGGGAAMSPQKAQLVEKIKVFQKASPENKEAWGAFIGATKDPSRHEVEKLQEFCNTYGM